MRTFSKLQKFLWGEFGEFLIYERRERNETKGTTERGGEVKG